MPNKRPDQVQSTEGAIAGNSPSGHPPAARDSDQAVRFLHYSLFCALGLPTMLVFGLYNFVKGNLTLTLIITGYAVALSAGWVILRISQSGTTVYRANALLFCAMLLYLTHIGGENGSKILWLYTFPPIAFFLMGRIEGAVWSTMLFLSALPLLFNFPNWPHQYGYGAEFAFRFLFSYIIVSCITFFYELFRYRFRADLEGKNRELEREIAEKNRMAESLRLSEDRYRAIYQQAAEGILLIDPKGSIVESNPQMLQMLGYDAKELIGTNLLSLIHPDDLNNAPPQIERLMAGETVTQERRLRTADHVYLFFEMSGRKISNGLLLLMYRDVTERKFAEIALESANRKLNRLANIDGLTQIANRRQFDSALTREWRRMRRAGKPLTLILGDIDFFKHFNDLYGHQAGDDCLRSVAGILAASVFRADDLVARYGGEEFVVILPDTELEGGRVVAENMRQAIAEHNISHQDSPVSDRVTMSFGVASTNDFAGNGRSTLIQSADRALYQAKEEGRNRVTVHQQRIPRQP